MSEKKRISGLGRGLSALMEEIGPASAHHTASNSSAGARTAATLPVARLTPNAKQPRRRFDEAAMAELVESVRLRGVLQPLLVRPMGADYEIVAGERRWRAAQAAQLHEVPVVIREIDDATAFEIALVENIQRSDLNPIEEAEGYRRLIDEFGHTQEALAKLVGKSRSHIANLLRLLDLPPPVRAMVVDGALSMGHARALLTAENPVELARKVADQQLSVRQVEALVAAASPAAARKRKVVTELRGDPDIESIQRLLSDALGMAVTIETATGASGAITLRYSTLDQFDLLCQRLMGEARI